MFNMDIFKVRIKERCKITGVSQKHLCDAVGKSKQYLNNVWDGKCSATSDEISSFASILSTTPAYLTGETDDPAPTNSPDELSSEEKELLELYRSVSPEKQELFKKIIEQMKG